jgi:excinuclease UvrABC nuclease subunit
MQISWSAFQSFTEENVKKDAPRDSGVYLLWVKLKNDKWQCYYAGQAENLESRLLAHLSNGEENTCIKSNVLDYISGYEYAKFSLQNDRDGIEKFLYDYYKPSCNEKDPGGTPIAVNLP